MSQTSPCAPKQTNDLSVFDMIDIEQQDFRQLVNVCFGLSWKHYPCQKKKCQCIC